MAQYCHFLPAKAAGPPPLARHESYIFRLQRLAAMPEERTQPLTIHHPVCPSAVMPPVYRVQVPLSTVCQTTLTESEAADALNAVQVRRDFALEEFAELSARLDGNDPGALRHLHERAAGLVADKTSHWPELVEAGPLAQAQQSLEAIDQLAAGNGSVLASATVRNAAPPAPERLYGICGRLQTWDLKSAPGIRV